jgi:hypothetical protein
LFAAIYHHDSRTPVAVELKTRLRDALNRSDGNIVTECGWPGVYLLSVDVGALGTPSFVESAGGGVTLAGGELFVASAERPNHEAELAAASASLRHGGPSCLRPARGTFCLCDFDPHTHRLVVAVDRLGVRPVYYYENKGRVVVATALRVFEALRRELQIDADVEAVAELITLGYPLADRTPLTGVRCLRGGEAVVWSGGQRHSDIYWRWEDVPEDQRSPSESASSLHDTFAEAIRIRNRGDRRVRAFLSGGLDSRCVVTALASTGVAVDTFNMSPDDSFDRIIGNDYALRLGASHHALKMSAEIGGDVWPRLIGDFVRAEPPQAGSPGPDRPRVFWSGDGGSVGVGRVYMSEDVVESLRAGDAETAVQQFLSYNRTPYFESMLARDVRRWAKKSFYEALLEEFTRFRCSDRGKALFLFLLENDQRRHMALFFENIDVNRIEYQMPFFDGEFLAAAAALNVDSTLRHRFYVRHWLPTFGPIAADVAWQAYPGHEPCPLSAPKHAVYQWAGRTARTSGNARLKAATRALRAAVSPSLPTAVLSRGRLMGLGVSAMLTGRDYDYAFRAVETYYRYFSGNASGESGSGGR